MPIFQLKNLRSLQGHETLSFTTTLYIDGERAATINNSGNGGSHHYYWFNTRLEEVFKDHIEKLKSENHFKYTFDHDDTFINELIEDLELQKLCKKKTLFRIPNGKAYFEINEPYSAEVKAWIIERHGDRVEIMNEKFLQPQR